MLQTSIFRMTGEATRSEGEGWPTTEYSDRSESFECMDCRITGPNVMEQTEKLTLQQVQVAPLQQKHKSLLEMRFPSQSCARQRQS
jgi:hypothetical protein